MPSSSEGPTEDKRIALNRERLEIIDVTLTVLKPSNLCGDPFVTLKVKLSKTQSTFKVGFVATVNMFPPIDNIYATDIEGYAVSQITLTDYVGDKERRDKRTNSSPAHNEIPGNVHFQVASLDDRLLGDYFRIA